MFCSENCVELTESLEYNEKRHPCVIRNRVCAFRYFTVLPTRRSLQTSHLLKIYSNPTRGYLSMNKYEGNQGRMKKKGLIV